MQPYTWLSTQQGIRVQDSLLKLMEHHKADTAKVNTLNELSNAYAQTNQDLVGQYANQALILARKLHYPQRQAAAYTNFTSYYESRSDY